MLAKNEPGDSGPNHARSLAWSQKVRREMRRLMFQISTLATRPAVLRAENRFLFVLGHMRSGSSLLCHLLCSSPDIAGYSGAQNNYRRPSDLVKLLTAIRYYTGENPQNYRYALDRVVTADREVRGSVLADDRTRYLFLVREPVASIASIVATRETECDEPFQQLVTSAIDHYTQRLGQLVELARGIGAPERCLLLTHRQLIHETPTVFGKLESVLDLSEPLCEEYRVMPTTGVLGIGDPSPSILRGVIDRTLPQKHVALPARLQARLADCHATCLDQLASMMPTSVDHSTAVRRLAA